MPNNKKTKTESEIVDILEANEAEKKILVANFKKAKFGMKVSPEGNNGVSWAEHAVEVFDGIRGAIVGNEGEKKRKVCAMLQAMRDSGYAQRVLTPTAPKVSTLTDAVLDRTADKLLDPSTAANPRLLPDKQPKQKDQPVCNLPRVAPHRVSQLVHSFLNTDTTTTREAITAVSNIVDQLCEDAEQLHDASKAAGVVQVLKMLTINRGKLSTEAFVEDEGCHDKLLSIMATAYGKAKGQKPANRIPEAFGQTAASPAATKHIVQTISAVVKEWKGLQEIIAKRTKGRVAKVEYAQLVYTHKPRLQIAYNKQDGSNQVLEELATMWTESPDSENVRLQLCFYAAEIYLALDKPARGKEMLYSFFNLSTVPAQALFLDTVFDCMLNEIPDEERLAELFERLNPETCDVECNLLIKHLCSIEKQPPEEYDGFVGWRTVPNWVEFDLACFAAGLMFAKRGEQADDISIDRFFSGVFE